MPLKAQFKICGIAIIVCVILIGVAVAAQDDPDVQAQIESAMSAAPLVVAQDATIIGTSPEGDPIVLREGTNGWTCRPDWDVSPDNDPICLDETFLRWDEALATGTDFETEVPGLAYMLQGGSDPSNTDPFAMEPAEGEEWIKTPPHIMIVFPTGTDLSMFTTEHASGHPYVMWAGTPYEHIMMPVVDTEHEH